MIAGEVTLAELIGLVAWDNLTQLSNSDRFNVQVGFWSRREDPEISRRLLASYRQVAQQELRESEEYQFGVMHLD